MKILIFLFLLSFNSLWASDLVSKSVSNLNLFEDVLDAELCEEQLRYIVESDTLLLATFLDAGIRTPRGLLTGNTLDLGNYHQCLRINQEIPNSVVEGKYCMVDLPLNQDVNWPEFPSLPDIPEWPDIPWPELPWPELNRNTSRLSEKVLKGLKEYNVRKYSADTIFGGKPDTRRSRVAEDSPFAGLSFQLAVCIPKVCTTQQVLDNFAVLSSLGVQYEDRFCRLPNDKPLVVGDYVALSIFAVIILLVALSTSYDIRHNVYLGTDPKKLNKICLSFSAYTNTRRLVTYTPVPGALECLDGVRAFAMMWVIIGHTFVNQLTSDIMANPLDTLQWMMSLSSIWITAAPITVDTFFMLSGLLLVYTTNGKLTPMKLLKNLHLFYLNRILRILPLLAGMILLQISVLNWIFDGPYWNIVDSHVQRCRSNWWTTLLHVQNYANPNFMCLPHTWYLAIDMQLHILSPIILLWILTGKKLLAWSAMGGGLVALLAAATTFNFLKSFPSGPVIPARQDEQTYYVTQYYVNTLTRASPFLVGLIFGYLLSIYRGQKVVISKISAAILWLCAVIIGSLVVYSSYPIMQLDWDNQLVDDLINSFMRPAWALAIGWLIFACVHGYGGPINWILSLRMWKVLGRLSYAMYLTHYPLIFLVNAMNVTPMYFDVSMSILKFFTDFSLAVLVAFILTILIDSPCSVLIKHFLGGGIKKAPLARAANDIESRKAQENKQIERL